MASTDLTLVGHALALAKKHGFAQVTVEQEGMAFQATLEKPVIVSAPKATTAKVPMASVEPESAIIKSPFVGYFREIDPAPKVGQNVEAGESVAVIAVLGIANEIESDVSGVIEEVFVKDGDVVEYGQPLLRIKPNE